MKSQMNPLVLMARAGLAAGSALMLLAGPACAAPDAGAPADATAMEQAPARNAAGKLIKPDRERMHASVANRKEGLAFLADNQSRPGVVKLKSGLQYRVIKPGSGPRPAEEDIVRCSFVGKLVDGTAFEQSDPARKATIRVSPLIPGLKEAMKLMQAGSRWEIYIPPELGFGAEGKPPKVGPDAVLIYDVELLGIETNSSAKR